MSTSNAKIDTFVNQPFMLMLHLTSHRLDHENHIQIFFLVSEIFLRELAASKEHVSSEVRNLKSISRCRMTHAPMSRVLTQDNRLEEVDTGFSEFFI